MNCNLKQQYIIGVGGFSRVAVWLVEKVKDADLRVA